MAASRTTSTPAAAHSALFENRVRRFVYFTFFRFRHPTGVGRLACTSFGVAGVSLVLDWVSPLTRLGDVSAVLLIAVRTYRLIFHPEDIHDVDKVTE